MNIDHGPHQVLAAPHARAAPQARPAAYENFEFSRGSHEHLYLTYCDLRQFYALYNLQQKSCICSLLILA
jgi:hypothetical protein